MILKYLLLIGILANIISIITYQKRMKSWQVIISLTASISVFCMLIIEIIFAKLNDLFLTYYNKITELAIRVLENLN